VVLPARVRVTVGEHHRPTALTTLADKTVDIRPITNMERKVVHTGSPSLVGITNGIR
jgi:predicted RNA-binding protein Jag